MHRAGALAPALHALLTKDPAARPTGDDIVTGLRTLARRPNRSRAAARTAAATRTRPPPVEELSSRA
ncbi:MAG: hypothetical protein ACJ73S_16190 [Mycobacteriales bacterium]